MGQEFNSSQDALNSENQSETAIPSAYDDEATKIRPAYDEEAFAQSQGALPQPVINRSGAFAQPGFNRSGAFAQPDFNQSGVFAQPAGAHDEMFEKIAKEYREISGDYRIGEPIGRGGCAVVLEAWRLSDDMHVVIKVIQLSAGFDEKEAKVAIERFMREAKLIASLHEKHIVQCVDYGCYQGTPAMVLEFVNGLSLDQLIAKYGTIPLEYSTGIIRQLLSALVDTHAQKIIHRDIKPGNIMVFDSPPPFEIRVLDFGISSVQDGLQSQTLMTQQGNVRGTPSYMAPELFTGETKASIESDLYAVGLVYYECLTGEIAFNDKSFMRVAYKQVNEQLEIPGSIPKCISDIIFRLCAKNAADRYHSAQNVIDDIDACLPQALEEEEKCISEYEKTQKKRKQKSKSGSVELTTQQSIFSSKFRLIAILVVILLILIGFGIFFFAFPEEDQKDSPVVIQTIVKEDVKTKAELEKVNNKLAIVTASSIIDKAWNESVTDVNNQENEEANLKDEIDKDNKEKEDDKKDKKDKDNKTKDNKPKDKKKGHNSRPTDVEMDLPF